VKKKNTFGHHSGFSAAANRIIASNESPVVRIVAIPLPGVLYPAVRVMRSVFDWAMRRRIVRLYAELRALEQRARRTDSPEARAGILAELNALERKARRLEVPNEFAQMAYTLRTHINVVQARLEA
jgi:hypothetical protein